MLPVKLTRPSLQVVPHVDWRYIGRNRLAKVYALHDKDERMAFVVQLLATNGENGERYKLVIDELEVTVGIQAPTEEFIGDRERKQAQYCDSIFDDIVRYGATARDQL